MGWNLPGQLHAFILRADRAVLAGDHLQLPPTVLSPDAQALSLSPTAVAGAAPGEDQDVGMFGLFNAFGERREQ